MTTLGWWIVVGMWVITLGWVVYCEIEIRRAARSCRCPLCKRKRRRR